MDDINNATTNYNHMTQSVQRIADSINLLSLNASVEAARAGEAGKGFSVIADSIRSISDMSKRSVRDSQTNSENVDMAIEKVNKNVLAFGERTNELIDAVNDSIVNVHSISKIGLTITNSVERVNEMATRVLQMIEQANQVLVK